MTREKILIVYPSEWLAYSPTILNFVVCCQGRYNVEILAIDHGGFQKAKDVEGITYIAITPRLASLLTKARFYNLYKLYG